MHSASYSSSARLISPRFTCDECVAGMEWIEAYLEDPIFQVEPGNAQGDTAVDEDEDVDVDVDKDEDEDEDESLEVLRQQVREEERATDGTRTDDIAESVTAAVTASVKQEKEGGTEIKEEEAKSKEAEKRKVGKKKKKKKKKGDDDDEALDAMLAALRAEYTGDAPLEDEAASSNPAAAQEENSKKKRKKESPPQEDDDRQDREVCTCSPFCRKLQDLKPKVHFVNEISTS